MMMKEEEKEEEGKKENEKENQIDEDLIMGAYIHIHQRVLMEEIAAKDEEVEEEGEDGEEDDDMNKQKDYSTSPFLPHALHVIHSSSSSSSTTTTSSSSSSSSSSFSSPLVLPPLIPSLGFSSHHSLLSFYRLTEQAIISHLPSHTAEILKENDRIKNSMGET